MKRKPYISRKALTLSTFILLLFVMPMALFGQTIGRAIIRDVSQSSDLEEAFNADQIFKELLIDLDLKNSKKGVELLTALCGQRKIPEVRHAKLPEQKSRLSATSQRTEDLRQFLTKAKSDIDYLGSHLNDQSQTNLYLTLVKVVDEFDTQTTSKKICIISDLTEVSSALNATKYINNPEGIMEDYNSILRDLNNKAPLPNLIGFTIVLVTPGKTSLEFYMANFWKKMVSDLGGTAEVRGL